MDRHQANQAVFRDTYRLLMEHPQLHASWQKSRDQEVVYPGDTPLQVERKRYAEPSAVVVTQHRTMEAAGAYRDSHVCVLNFASATSPGGGVVGGSSAQEESLCRVSTLYPCLTDDAMRRQFYSRHYGLDARYNDDAIYTPSVVVFKSDTSVPELLPEGEWYQTDVITAAAPNLRHCSLSDTELAALHERRLTRILDIAVLHGVEVMVLGAFGCGAFRNDPRVVAEAMAKVIPLFRYAFKTIEFAVFTPPFDDTNWRVFCEVFA